MRLLKKDVLKVLWVYFGSLRIQTGSNLTPPLLGAIEGHRTRHSNYNPYLNRLPSTYLSSLLIHMQRVLPRMTALEAGKLQPQFPNFLYYSHHIGQWPECQHAVPQVRSAPLDQE